MPYCGLGAEVRVGLVRHRRRIFVAIYPRNDHLMLWIDGREFDLCDPAIRIRRPFFKGPFIRRTVVTRGQVEEVSFLAWSLASELSDSPTDMDFVGWIADTAASYESRRRAIVGFAAACDGVDYRNPAELERRFREAGLELIPAESRRLKWWDLFLF
jgi:hypothetical protein